MLYIYDADGTPIGMQYHHNSYFHRQYDVYWFEKNLQGDVVAVYDEDGDKLISYAYDAWGNFIRGNRNEENFNSFYSIVYFGCAIFVFLSW